MAPDTLANYLRDLGYDIREHATEAVEEARRNRANEFARGRAMAYYEVLSMMHNRAIAFDIPVDALSLDGIDPERDLL